MTGITFEQQLQFLNKSSLAVGEIMITWFSDFPEYQYLQLWANYVIKIEQQVWLL